MKNYLYIREVRAGCSDKVIGMIKNHLLGCVIAGVFLASSHGSAAGKVGPDAGGVPMADLIKHDFSCIPKPSIRKPFKVEPLPYHFAESLPKGGEEEAFLAQHVPAKDRGVYRAIFKAERDRKPGEVADYFQVLQPYLHEIKKVSLRIVNLAEMSGPASKVIFLGRSPYWLYETCEIETKNSNQFISLPFSGTPDVSMNGIPDDADDLDNVVTEPGLLNYFTFMEGKGLDHAGPCFVVDHLGSGRSMIGFYRIWKGFYKHLGKAAPSLTLVDMNLQDGVDLKKAHWSYASHEHQVQFTVNKFMYPGLRFMLPVVPLGMDSGLVSLLDFGSFEDESCPMPRYPAPAWELPPEEVARIGGYGRGHKALKAQVAAYLASHP